MTTEQTVNVSILGFGTVGAGVAECLLENRALIRTRTGITLNLVRIADLDITRDRGVAIPDGVLTTDAAEAIAAADIVVELIGGKTVADTFIRTALRAGKSVVSANKALLAERGESLFAEAAANNVKLYYEASVGGGIPIIKTIREALTANRIDSIYGILNGTCNYILSEMEANDTPLETVLKEAQSHGYAEADPSFDIDGIDTAHKTAILASLAYGKWFGTEKLYTEGIRHLQLEDIHHADELGYKIKLLGIIRLIDNNVEYRVHPALLPKDKMLAKVGGVYNAVTVHGDFVGNLFTSGRGAGRRATASAVMADVIDAALDRRSGSHERVPAFTAGAQFNRLIPMDEVVTRHYLRFSSLDRVGMYVKIMQILAQHNISVSGIRQSENHSDVVTGIIMTHLAKDGDMRRAIGALEALPEIQGKIIHIRTEVW